MSFAVTNLGVPEQVVQLAKTQGQGARRLLLKAWTAYGATAALLALVLSLTLEPTIGFLALGCLCYLVPMQAGLVTLGFAGVRTQALGALLQPTGLAVAASGFALDGQLTGSEAMVATALSYLIPMAVYWKAIPKDAPDAKASGIRTLLRQGSKWQIPMVCQRLVQRSDIMIVFVLFGPAQAGVYSVASQLSELCFTIPRQAAGQAYHLVVNGHPVNMRRSTAVAAISSVATSMCVGIAGWAAIVAVYGQAFADARLIILYLLPGPILGSAALVCSEYYRAKRTFKPSAISSATGAFIALGASLGLSPFLGVVGVAIGSSLGWATYSTISLYALRAHIRH